MRRITRTKLPNRTGSRGREPGRNGGRSKLFAERRWTTEARARFCAWIEGGGARAGGGSINSGFYVALIEIRRRGADPHGAVRSTASTVRELNDPKINCFDQFGCNMIGMNTARYTST